MLGHSMMYSFRPGPMDDGEVYTCEVTVNSYQLRSPIVMRGSLTLRVLCKKVAFFINIISHI